MARHLADTLLKRFYFMLEEAWKVEGDLLKVTHNPNSEIKKEIKKEISARIKEINSTVITWYSFLMAPIIISPYVESYMLQVQKFVHMEPTLYVTIPNILCDTPDINRTSCGTRSFNRLWYSHNFHISK